MAPPEAAQEGAQGEGRPTGAQRIGIVDAVAPSQRGGDQRQRLGPPRRAAEVEVVVDGCPQAQMPGEGGRQEQAGIGYQAVIVKDNANMVRVVAW